MALWSDKSLRFGAFAYWTSPIQQKLNYFEGKKAREIQKDQTTQGILSDINDFG